MIEVQAVKVKEAGYYINFANCNIYDKHYDSFLFDGEHCENTFHPHWVKINKKPEKISRMKTRTNTNYRYELKNKLLSSINLPQIIKREDFATYDSDEYEWVTKPEWKDYYSLYEEKSDKQDDEEIIEEFTFTTICEVDKITHKGTITINDEEITPNSQLIDKIFFPSILLPQKPCVLSSQQTYDIVREYIKNNINGAIAHITSDYDFCFTVKKRIKLAEVRKYIVDVNNGPFQKRKRKSKYVEKQKTHSDYGCFEMTHKGKNYRGYTPIEGFRANSHEELKANIDNYCKDLIDFINTPLEECKHCSGYGKIKTKIPELR